MDKYIVYKTGSGLGPQSVRKSSIIEFRVIDCIIGPPPPPPLGWSFFELAYGGVWDFHIGAHLTEPVVCFSPCARRCGASACGGTNSGRVVRFLSQTDY